LIADFDTAAVVAAVVAVETAVIGWGAVAVAVVARHLNSAAVRFVAANDDGIVAAENVLLRSSRKLLRNGDSSSKTIGRDCPAKE